MRQLLFERSFWTLDSISSHSAENQYDGSSKFKPVTGTLVSEQGTAL